MTPEARLAAAIELLDEIVRAAGEAGPSADMIVRRYFASHRFAGSSDRREIVDWVYGTLRDWQALAWRVRKAGMGDTPRTVLIARLHSMRIDPATVLTGQGYAAEPLSEKERKMVEALAQDREHPTNLALYNCPGWLGGAARSRFGEYLDGELAALNDRAAMDIRVNALRANRAELLKALWAEGIKGEATKLAPHGIRLNENINLSAHPLLRGGRVEVQDEGSQIAAYLVDVGPGMNIVELCAGAGGKSLAMAAEMNNSGQIHAFDLSKTKLIEMKKRVQRAGLRNVQVRQLAIEEKLRATFLARAKGIADRVVLDVPCSGTGTWRRNPELRLRLTAQRLMELLETQNALLKEGATMVKPGGRMIYITCSFLPEENEGRIKQFLEEHPDWRTINWRKVTKREALAKTISLSSMPHALQLSPGTHGTDGFFVAILEHSGA